MKYEILFLVGQGQEAKLPEIEKTVERFIVESEGAITEERWEEKRKLAYPIGKTVRGTFVARRFETKDQDYWGEENLATQKDPVQDITRKMNLFPDVMRFVIVRADGLLSLKDFAIKKAEEKEMGQQKFQKTDKNERPDREPTVRFRKEMIRAPRQASPAAPAPAETPRVATEETKVVKESEAVAEPEKPKKVKDAPVIAASTEDIDKKLDEILNA